MSYSYSGDPSLNPRDAVRWLVNDHPQNGAPYAEDEEIDWVLTQYPNPYRAAAEVADTIASIFAARPVKSVVGDLSLTYGDLQRAYSELGKALRRTARMIGISQWPNAVLSDFQKLTDAQDPDAVPPMFRRQTGFTPGSRPWPIPYVPEAWR